MLTRNRLLVSGSEACLLFLKVGGIYIPTHLRCGLEMKGEKKNPKRVRDKIIVDFHEAFKKLNGGSRKIRV